MMYSLGAATWWRLVIWTAIGMLVYVFYGYKHSKVRLAVAAAGVDRSRARLSLAARPERPPQARC